MTDLSGSQAPRDRADDPPAPPRPRPVASGSIEMATLVGLVGAFAMIATAVALGGSPGSFLDLPAVLIVGGGTLAVTTISFSLPEVARALRATTEVLVHKSRDAGVSARNALGLADRARQIGVLGLQAELPQLRDDPFLHRAIAMVIDGAPIDEIERTMTADLEATAARRVACADVLRRAAEVAPAMGLIGTLVGLVQMLGNLDNPETIGPSMAVALLTTFYGALLANMVFMPLAAKLQRIADLETLINRISVFGAVSIGRQENPRRLESLLNSVLPPGRRVRYFD